jgi:TP901 family phage tail tape measure protein
MADDSMKLELVLVGNSLLGKVIGKDIGFLKKFQKEADAAQKGVDKIDAAKKKLAQTASKETKLKGNAKLLVEGFNRDLNRATAIYDRFIAKIRRKPPTVPAPAVEMPKERGGRRRTRRGADDSFEDDLVTGGAGATGLWLAKNGLGSAMSKESAMTDLSSAFFRSSISAQDLNAQMLQAEKIADRLGNKLPGTTADYINMLTVMRQRGIETKAVLEGAGEAAAYLSVANKEDRLEVGKNLARFGQMFNLKTRDEYINAADLMSRANTTYGIQSDELMEAVKDFSGRSGKGLGLDGGKGAEDTLRFLAFLRAKTGLEGLTVGTAASSFFNQYQQAKEKKKDPTAELKKMTGVDLKIFDNKGKFLGLENAVKEFSKLQGKLTDEQMGKFGSDLAGEEGKSVFMAMVKNGAQWGSFNNEMTESIALMDRSAKNAENLTNKVEALTGSLQNLGAAGFKPLVKPLGTVVDKANAATGFLTNLATAYPTTAGTTAGVLSLGAAFLALKGGSGIASRFLGGANSQIVAVGDNATKAKGRLGGLKNSLTSVAGVTKVLLAVELLGATWEQIDKLQSTMAQYKKTQAGIDDIAKGDGASWNAYKESLAQEGKMPDYNQKAKDIMGFLQEGNNRQLEFALDPKRMDWYRYIYTMGGSLSNPFFQNAPKTMDVLSNPELKARFKSYGNDAGIFGSVSSRVAYEQAGAVNFQKRAPALEDPNVMAAFRRDVPQALNFSDQMKQSFETMLKLAFPDSFKQSSEQLAQQSNQLNQSFLNLQQPVTDLGAVFPQLNTNSNNASMAVNNFANSANSAAARLNNVQVAPVQIPMFAPGPPLAPGRAAGGKVSGGQPYMVGEAGKEMFVPSSNGTIVSNNALRRGGASGGSYSITINVNGAGDPKAVAMEVERKLAAFMSEVREEMQPDSVAKRVAFAAERDYERT